MVKNISIEDDVWKALTQLKIDTHAKTLSDVIRNGMLKKQKVK